MSLKLRIMTLMRVRRAPQIGLVMGRHCIGVPFFITGDKTDRVAIGNFCSFGANTTIVAHYGHIPERKEDEKFRISTYPIAWLGEWKPKYSLPMKRNYVIIGSDVWTGVNVTVMPGLKIGNGAIIGANAVVTHDIPDYAVAFGIPAKVVRYRYTEEQIKALLEIKWWNWPDKKIKANCDFFYDDIDEFIKKFKD